MPIEIGDKRYYTVEDIHEKTGMYPRTIRQLLKDGRPGARSRVRPEVHLQAYFEEEPLGNE